MIAVLLAGMSMCWPAQAQEAAAPMPAAAPGHGQAPGGTSHLRPPRVGLGVHTPVMGWGFGRGFGFMMPGIAVELPVLLSESSIAAVARWDLLWFPGLDADVLATQTVLAGIQRYRVGPYPVGLSGLVGYSIAHGDTSPALETGLVADLGLWYWLSAKGWHLGMHTRFGLEDGNEELRVVYLSLGYRRIF